MHNAVRFASALSDRLALRIINLLRRGELCQCELEESLRAGSYAVKTRVNKLKRAGLIKSRKRSLWIGFQIVPKYADLIETFFETFEAELLWGEEVTEDASKLDAEMEKRVLGWCADTRPHEHRKKAQTESADPV